MNGFKDFLLKASAYTVIILSVFYIVGAFSGITEHGISWHKYLLILGYGLLISASELLARLFPKRKILGILINYTALLLGFLVVFIFSSETGSVATKIFIAIALFTVIYAVVRVTAMLVKKAIDKANPGKKALKRLKEEKDRPKYTPLYGGK